VPVPLEIKISLAVTELPKTFDGLCERGALDDIDMNYLNNLKFLYQDNELTMVHGTLDCPQEFDYIYDTLTAAKSMHLQQTPLCFIGHSHSPVIFTKSGEDIGYTRDTRIELKKDISYIVNVGSVGQPRDGDPRGSYVVYDADDNTIEIKRVSYDVEKAQNKIISAGLPPFLAERLSVGR